MRDGVPADPRTIRDLLEAIRDERDQIRTAQPFDAYVRSMAIVSEHAVAALAQLDAAEHINITARRSGAVALVPDSGVVLDPQHNDTP